jgi:glutaryl-CoA dehydrogenase
MAHAAFNWQDPFLLDSQLEPDERMVRDAAAAYCQDKLLPRVTQAFRDGTTDPAIFREMGELGLLGPTIPEQYGGPGLNYVAYGLIAREVERVDSGYRSMMSVQSSWSWCRFLNLAPRRSVKSTCPSSLPVSGLAASA